MVRVPGPGPPPSLVCSILGLNLLISAPSVLVALVCGHVVVAPHLIVAGARCRVTLWEKCRRRHGEVTRFKIAFDAVLYSLPFPTPTCAACSPRGLTTPRPPRACFLPPPAPSTLSRQTVRNCVITPCGHSFCRSCAGDAVSRKHVCPVCQRDIVGGETALIRNYLVDDTTQAILEATEETDTAYMRLLFSNVAGKGTPAGTNDPCPLLEPPRPGPLPPPHARSPSGEGMPLLTSSTAVETALVGETGRGGSATSGLSPVEEVLVSRMRDAFLGYQSYYAREQASHEAEVKSLTLRLEAARRGEGGDAEREARELEDAIEASKRRFSTSMEALVRDFDAHAAAAAPPPPLLPSTVTIIVASRGVRFDTQLMPTHFPENVYDKVGGTRVFSHGIHACLLARAEAELTRRAHHRSCVKLSCCCVMPHQWRAGKRWDFNNSRLVLGL